MTWAGQEDRRFNWASSEARRLLRALSSELPTFDDLYACARVSHTDLSRARLSGTSDNAWQSLIEIAHESDDPDQRNALLAAAAERSAIVKDAVTAYLASEKS